MKILLLAGLLLLPPDGDRERGIKLYQEGKYTEAAKAFEAAIAAEGESPELQYNLAMARWRAGELPGAEEAAEKMGAMSGDAFHARYQGVLGAVRHSESAALEQQGDAARQSNLEQAIGSIEQGLKKSEAARDFFARAGAGTETAGSASRNLERELQRIAALRQKLEEMKEELEKQKQEQKDKDKKDQENKDQKDQDKKDQDKKDQENKDQKDQDKKDKDKSDQQNDKNDQKSEQGEPKPEPKPEPQSEPKDQKPQQGEQPKDEKQGESKPEPQPAEQPNQPEKEKRQDAPGEVQMGELSPEQSARLLEQLKKLDEQLQAYRARARSARKPVEKDW